MEYLWVDWGVFGVLLGVGVGAALGGAAGVIRAMPDLIDGISRYKWAWTKKEQKEQLNGPRSF